MQEVEKAVSAAPASRRTRSATHVTVFIGVAAAMLVVFVAFSRQAVPDTPVVQQLVSTVPQQPDPVVEPQLVPVSDEKLVQFRNPFDKNEVFEFPAGTTRSEARDAVAEILRERAVERLAQESSVNPH